MRVCSEWPAEVENGLKTSISQKGFFAHDSNDYTIETEVAEMPKSYYSGNRMDMQQAYRTTKANKFENILS